MAFNNFPYTDFHELNLDWVITQIKSVVGTLDEFVKEANTIHFADPILWDINSGYGKNKIVIDGNGTAYISKDYVPIGKTLTNTDYWVEVYNFSALLNTYQAALRNDNEEFKAEITADNETFKEMVNNSNAAYKTNLNSEWATYKSNTTASLNQIASATNRPVVVSSVSEMTNQGLLYVLAGTGAMYYYNGSAFVTSGITYGSLTDYINYIGNLSTNYSNANDVPTQTVGYVPGTVTSSTFANMPEYGSTNGYGYLYTIGTSMSRQQFWLNKYTGTFYIRQLTGTAWGTWIDVTGRSANAIKYVSNFSTTYSDANSIDVQTVGYVPGTVTAASFANLPRYGDPSGYGYIYTLGTFGSRQQIWIGKYDKSMFVRELTGEAWSNWVMLSAGNSNARLYGVGNSMLRGSVWINGTFDHLPEYNNSPYGLVANAVGIPQANTGFRLLSSAGLCYDAGEGTFLNHILGTDINSYDVLLTHVALADMQSYPVGTVDATAGDGTIAGAVVRLCTYLASNAPRTQLILASCPICSNVPATSGQNVFTGAHGNGYSIDQLDYVMRQLADKYHFHYVTYKGLNLAYVYQSYTDLNNIHANNERSYRIMGAYLGGQAGAKVHF